MDMFMFTLYSLEDLELFTIRFRKQRKVFTEEMNNVSQFTEITRIQIHIYTNDRKINKYNGRFKLYLFFEYMI